MRRCVFWVSSLFFAGLCWSSSAWAAHGYALWGDLKYPPGFAHFDYVNPQAPKGGTLRLVSNLRMSTFDKYNPFSVKGSAPAYLGALLFESLLTSAWDETASAYGLLAEDVVVAPDGLSATFRLRPEARFHNGDPVLARDVQHSLQMLMSPQAAPGWRTTLQDVVAADVLADRVVRFRFKQALRELPLTVGAMPVFSHRWGQDGGKPKALDQIVTEVPIASGPYRIGPVVFGKDITYVRDAQYWGRFLNVRQGTGNFDAITVKIYQDSTAKLEALKAGEFDLMRFFSAADWARRVTGRRFDSGELVKGEFAHRQPTGFQSYVLNTRRPLLQDARVRQALTLALDFEWMNRQLFYSAYSRVQGLFGNTRCQAQGAATAPELALLEPWRQQLGSQYDAIVGPMLAPTTHRSPDDLRQHLRQAQSLLAQAGWVWRDGALRNAQGQPLVLEYLDSSDSGARVVTPWARNLEKIGVRLVFRPVDFALYQQRLQNFDFDITSIAFAGTHNPGQEYADLFGSAAADQVDSGNLSGVRSPVVDALIARMTQARTPTELQSACRALDRVIAHGYYLVPQWYASTHRLAYNAWRLQHPRTMPPYANAENWAMDVWWSQASPPSHSMP